MSKYTIFPALFICFLTAALVNNPLVVLIAIVLGLGVAYFGKVNVYTLLIVAVPFTITINHPVTLTASISDFVAPLALFLACKKAWPNIKNLISEYKYAFWWASALFATIALSLTGNSITYSGFFSSLGKLSFAMLFGLVSLIYTYENRHRLNKMWIYAEVWIRTSAAISGIGILAYILLLVGIHTDLMYESARLQAVFDNPNSFAAYEVVSLGIAAAFAIRKRKPLLNGLSLLILIALILSNSRAATIAVVVYVVLGFFIFLKPKVALKRWAIYGFTLITVLFLLMPAVNVLINFVANSGSSSSAEINVYPSISSTFNPDDEALSGKIENPVTQRESVIDDSRMFIWETALSLWSKDPVQGVGFGQFIYLSKTTLGTSYVVHNSFLSFLTETGILGFCVFTGGFIAISINLLKSRLDFNKVLFLTLVALGVMMLSNNLENTRYCWLLLGTCYSVPLLLRTAKENKN